MKLKVNSVSQRYKDKLALDDINIEFSEGIWGLLGPNGAGKTTLMQILVGIQNPTAGAVKLNGEKIESLDMEYRQILGYLPQKFGYYDDLTVAGYLRYIGGLKGLSVAEADTKMDELLQVLNLYEVKNKKIRKLSGGMKQRVGIVQTMLNDPKILILDEPTAGLDIEERRRFREYIVQESADKIVIISTHIVSDIEFISNHVAMINDGRVICNGDTGELKNELAGKVWEAVIATQHLAKVQKDLLLTNYHNVDNNSISIRYVADQMEMQGSKHVESELSDYYLFMNQKQKEGA